MRKYPVIMLTLGMAGSAHAQEGVDWGSIMHAEAMGSAMQEAAREGAHTPKSTRRAAVTDADRARTRAHCAKARGLAAAGVQDERIPKLISLCRRAGY